MIQLISAVFLSVSMVISVAANAAAEVPGTDSLNVSSYLAIANRASTVANTAGMQIDERYSIAADALGKMHDSISNVNEVLLMGGLEQNMNLSINVWSDADFRNWADNTETWATTLGLVVAAVGPFIADGDSRFTAIGVGVGGASLGKLVGAIFGQQTGQKFEEKAAFVEYTRSAYNDLMARANETSSYISSNETLRTNIAALLNNDFKNPLASPEQKLASVLKASAFIPQFDNVLLQLPAVYKLYERTVERYCPGIMSEISARGSSNLGAFECKTQPKPDMKLVLKGDTLQYLQRAARGVLDLKKNAASANAIREITPVMRAVFNPFNPPPNPAEGALAPALPSFY